MSFPCRFLEVGFALSPPVYPTRVEMTPSRSRSSSWTPQKQPPARIAVSVLFVTVPLLSSRSLRTQPYSTVHRRPPALPPQEAAPAVAPKRFLHQLPIMRVGEQAISLLASDPAQLVHLPMRLKLAIE